MNGTGTQSPISEFFKDRHVLITGATGFIGKVLAEKLLRSCSDIGVIYILIRSKNGVDVKTRLEQLVNTAMFDQLRKLDVKLLEKLVPIQGDITMPDLGISNEDRAVLMKNISVVFHSAATVKFDEALKPSVAMNLLGTKRLVELCQNMPKLEALVHVSTAYCNCNLETVLEEVYPPPAKPDRIIQLVESLDEKLLNSITPQIIESHPNTYTYTKGLAEQVLLEYSNSLPIAIVRPSIVTAAWKEPTAGWVDNFNGPTGLFVGAAKGVLRTLLCHRENIADLIPVDVAINLMIAVAWNLAATRNEKQNRIAVYNCSSGLSNPIYWGDIERMTQKFIVEHPCSEMIWYPGGSFKSNSILNSISVAALHMTPAYIVDIISRLSGKKPIMVRIQKKMQRATTCLEFFTTHEWKFVNRNMLGLYSQLNPTDKVKFNFNINELNWTNYLEQYWLGVRKFVLKEDPGNMGKARQHLRKYYWIHRLTQVLLVTLIWRSFFSRSQVLRGLCGQLLQLVMYMSNVLLSFLPISYRN